MSDLTTTRLPTLQPLDYETYAREAEKILRTRLGMPPLDTTGEFIQAQITRGLIPPKYSQAIRSFIEAEEDPNIAVAKLNSALFYSRQLDIPVEAALANHESVAKAYWGSVKTPITGWEAISQSFDAGLKSFQLGNLYADARDTGMTKELQAKITELEDAMPAPDKFKRSLPVEALKAAASSIPYTAAAFGGSLLESGIVALASYIVPPASLAMAAVGAIAKLVGMVPAARSQGGLEYREMVQAGMNPQAAAVASKLSGWVQAAIEQDSVKGLFPSTKLWGSFARTLEKKVGEDILKGAYRYPLISFATRMGTRMVSEGLEEGLQAAVSLSIQEGVRQFSETEDGKQIPGKTWEEVVQNLTENVVGGALGAIPLSALGEPISIARDIREWNSFKTKRTIEKAEAGANLVDSKAIDKGVKGEAEPQILTGARAPLTFQAKEVAPGTVSIVGTSQTEGEKRVGTVLADLSVDDEKKKIQISSVAVDRDLAKKDKAEAAAQIGDIVRNVRQLYEGYAIEWAPDGKTATTVKAEIERQSPGFFTAEYKRILTADRLRAQVQTAFKPGSRVESDIIMDIIAGREAKAAAAQGREIDLSTYIAGTFDSTGIARSLEELPEDRRSVLSELLAQNKGASGLTYFVDQRTGSLLFDPVQAKAAREHVRAAVLLLPKADEGTLFHELTHVIETMDELAPGEKKALEEHFGKPYEELTVADRDEIAYGALKFLRTGKVEGPAGIRGVFEKLAALFQNVVARAREAKIKLSPALNDFYSQVFLGGAQGQAIISQQTAAAEALNADAPEEAPEIASQDPKDKQAALLLEAADDIKPAPMTPPTRVGTGYKIFDSYNGQIYPLFIGAKAPTPVGEWMKAQNLPTSGFAPRPGWHLGATIPDAPWLKSADGQYWSARRVQGKRVQRVWAEVEYTADQDYQSIADASPTRDIKHAIPEGGYYKFDEANRGTWIIAGGIRVKRILTEDERQQIMKAQGYDEAASFAPYLKTHEKRKATLEAKKSKKATEGGALFEDDVRPEDRAAFDAAVKAFGTTARIREAGYALPDGTLLDFTGRNQAGGYTLQNGRYVTSGKDYLANQRSTDHREISLVEGEEMNAFIDRGAMRMDAQGDAGLIDLGRMPTPRQQAVIRQIIETSGGAMIEMKDGKRRASVEAFDMSPTKAIGYIRRFYNGEDVGNQLFEQRTDTPEFKAWFKNSKVVDEDGKPLVVYHGSGRKFDQFDLRIAQDKEGRQRGLGLGAGKIYLTAERRTGELYAENAKSRKLGRGSHLYELYAKIENPITEEDYQRRFKEISGKDIWDDALSQKERDGFIEKLDKQVKEDGFDGIIDIHPDGTFGQIAVFSPTQIKSVDNQGMWDPNDPRILFEEAPFTPEEYLDPERFPGTKPNHPLAPIGSILFERKEVERAKLEAASEVVPPVEDADIAGAFDGVKKFIYTEVGMLSDLIDPATPWTTPEEGMSLIEYARRYFSDAGIAKLRETFAGDTPPAWVENTSLWNATKDDLKLAERIRKGEEPRKTWGEAFLAGNRKTGGHSWDFAMATCLPTARCSVCYAKAAATMMENLSAARVRHSIVTALYPFEVGKAIAMYVRSTDKLEAPILRINGSGDTTFPWQIAAINAAIEYLDRPMHIFSRSHHPRVPGTSGLSEVSNGSYDPADPSNGVVVYKMGSIDKQLVKEYGVEYLRDNLKKRGIINSYLVGDVEDIPIVKDLREKGVFAILHIHARNDIIQALDDAGLLATTEHSGSEMATPACPCALEAGPFLNGCSTCLVSEGPCFAWGSQIAMTPTGDLIPYTDLISGDYEHTGVPLVPMSAVGTPAISSKQSMERKVIANAYRMAASDIQNKISRVRRKVAKSMVIENPRSREQLYTYEGTPEGIAAALKIVADWRAFADRLDGMEKVEDLAWIEETLRDDRATVDGIASMDRAVNRMKAAKSKPKPRKKAKGKDEALFETRAHPDELGTMVPTGKSPMVDPIKDLPIVGLEQMRRDPQAIPQAAKVIARYPNTRAMPNATPEQQVRAFMDHVVENLIWLYDHVPAEVKVRSKLWYDGARAITDRWVKKYGLSERQVAGIIAVLSPTKDWFQNMSIAERVLDTMSATQDFLWDAEMDARVAALGRKKEPSVWLRPQNLDTYQRIKGRNFKSLAEPFEKAQFTRLWHEAHSKGHYRIVSPEGDFNDYVRNTDGSESSLIWSDFNALAKAISIYEDGSIENISRGIGNEHKVRSFYNNILVPNSHNGHVTVDTHAVAAALFRPLSGSSREVINNFGANFPGDATGPKNNSNLGIAGIFPIYAEAYREAAAIKEVLPRELQSITWEAIRGLYTDVFKIHQTDDIETITSMWYSYGRGETDAETVRRSAVDLAGGITSPSWHRPGIGIHDTKYDSTYEGPLSKPQVLRGDPERSGDPGNNPPDVQGSPGGEATPRNILREFDLLAEASEFETYEDFKAAYLLEDGDEEAIKEAWEAAHDAPQIVPAAVADRRFISTLKGNEEAFLAFLEALGATLYDQGKDRKGITLVEAAAVKIAKGGTLSDAERARAFRFIEANPKRYREQYARISGDPAMIAQLEGEDQVQDTGEFVIEPPATVARTLSALTSQHLRTLRDLDPDMRKEYDEAKLSYDEVTASGAQIREGVAGLENDLAEAQAKYTDYRSKFSYAEKQIVVRQRELASLEGQVTAERVKQRFAKKMGQPYDEDKLAEMVRQRDDLEASIRKRIKSLAPGTAMREAGYRAAKQAIKETRAEIQKRTREARARQAERELMIGLAKQILRPVVKRTDYKIGLQIKAIQKTIDGKFRRNIPGWDIDTLRKMFNESFDLSKVLPPEVAARLKRRPLNDWTLDEIKDLHKRVEKLREEGKAVYEAKLAALKLERVQTQIAMVQALEASGKYVDQPPYGTDEFIEQTKKDTSLIKEWDRSLQTIHRIVRTLDNGQEGAFYQALVEGKRVAYASEKDGFDRRWGAVMKKMEDLKIKPESLYGEKVALGDTHITKWDAMGLYIGLRNQRTAEAIIYGNMMNQRQRALLSDGDLAALASKNLMDAQAAAQSLTAPERELAEFFIQDGDLNFDRLAEATYQYENRMPEREGVYFPHERRMSTGEGDKPEEIMDQVLDAVSKAERGVGKSPTLNRITIGKRHQSPIVLDAFGVYRRGMERQEHYIGYAGFISKANLLIKNKFTASDVRYMIKQTHGQGYLDYLDRWISETANPKAFKDFNKPAGGVERTLKFFRGPLGIAYLGLRTSSAFKQLITSPIPFLPYAKETMLSRMIQNLNPADFMKTLTFAREHSAIIRHRVALPTEAWIRAMGEAGALQRGLKTAAQMSMKLIEWADAWAVTTGWMAVYEQAIKRMADGDLSDAEIQARAIQEADKIVEETQPTSHPEDLAPLFKMDSEAMKILTQFQTPLNVVYNQIFHDVPDAFKTGHAGRGLGILAGYLWVGVFLALLRSPRDDDDDETKTLKDILSGLLSQPLEAIPFVGGMAANSATRLITGDGGYRPSDPFPGFSKALSGVEKIITSGDNEEAVKGLTSILEGSGMLVGVPTSAIKEYSRLILEGDLGALIGRPKK